MKEQGLENYWNTHNMREILKGNAKGKIDEEEYLDICKSINKQIDSKSEYKELKKSESEFKSEKQGEV